jgi:hypothetical protein
VRCPECGEEYENSYRPSVNLDIEPWTEEELRAATMATCPSCGFEVELDSLIVADGTWTFGDAEPSKQIRPPE